MIEDRYTANAMVAVNLFRTLMLAVESCGADPELTEIVTTLSDRQDKLRRLFGLTPGQITADIDPEKLRADIRNTVTVYDTHTPPENRGPWRHRLVAVADALDPAALDQYDASDPPPWINRHRSGLAQWSGTRPHDEVVSAEAAERRGEVSR